MICKLKVYSEIPRHLNHVIWLHHRRCVKSQNFDSSMVAKTQKWICNILIPLKGILCPPFHQNMTSWQVGHLHDVAEITFVQLNSSWKDMCNLRCTYVNRYVQLEVGITVLLPNICFSNVFLCMNMGLFGYDYKLLFRRENARSEKIPPNALRYGRLSTSRLQLAGRVCTENQESEIAATISILCIAARPSRGFLVSEDKQAHYSIL